MSVGPTTPGTTAPASTALGSTASGPTVPGPAPAERPLAGLRVLVPRAPERAGALVAALRRAGAEPVAAPLVHIGPPEDTAALDAAVAALATGAYEWLVVTSGFTVDALEASGARTGRTLADAVTAGRAARAGSTQVAAVGDATAAALARSGVEVDFVPRAEQSARGMLAEWPGRPAGDHGTGLGTAHSAEDGPAAGPAVLLPQGDLAEPTLADGLAAHGLRPHVVVSYRNSPAAPLPAALVTDLAAGTVGAVVLTSGSTARRLAEQVTLPAGTLVCCIGPRTAEVAAALGLPAGEVAAGPHPGAVVDALVRAARDRDAGAAAPSDQPVQPPSPSPVHSPTDPR